MTTVWFKGELQLGEKETEQETREVGRCRIIRVNIYAKLKDSGPYLMDNKKPLKDFHVRVINYHGNTEDGLKRYAWAERHQPADYNNCSCTKDEGWSLTATSGEGSYSGHRSHLFHNSTILFLLSKVWSNKVITMKCNMSKQESSIHYVPDTWWACIWTKSTPFWAPAVGHLLIPQWSTCTFLLLPEVPWLLRIGAFFILQICSDRYACQDYITKHSINTNMNTKKVFLN